MIQAPVVTVVVPKLARLPNVIIKNNMSAPKIKHERTGMKIFIIQTYFLLNSENAASDQSFIVASIRARRCTS